MPRGNRRRTTPLKLSALLGIDPVAGSSCFCLPTASNLFPAFRSTNPRSGTGTGLSNQRAYGVCPPGAPNGINHAEFFNEMEGSKKSLRRGIGGIFVAFLKAYLEGQADDLINIVESPNRAPITFDPVISIEE
ncbi:hypothetical protein HAX54_005737 [Datura stramonium]|uniref:Uncharacterized protein n=1 Tax=Datura stramonium TaxID=4076 RepID=A0ABS8RU92_DATST|nr:hypothetical protein [Datura stramonium]